MEHANAADKLTLPVTASMDQKVFSTMRLLIAVGLVAARWKATAPPRDLPNTTICSSDLPNWRCNYVAIGFCAKVRCGQFLQGVSKTSCVSCSRYLL